MAGLVFFVSASLFLITNAQVASIRGVPGGFSPVDQNDYYDVYRSKMGWNMVKKAYEAQESNGVSYQELTINKQVVAGVVYLYGFLVQLITCDGQNGEQVYCTAKVYFDLKGSPPSIIQKPRCDRNVLY